MSDSGFDLSGKVAVVTGASRGIGEAIAVRLAKAGADLVIASRKTEGLDETAATIEALGRKALIVPTNTSNKDQVYALINKSIETFGGIDILVNNAATNPHYGPLLESEDSHWEKTIQVNLQGYFWAIKASVPSMQKRGGGKIINVASIAGLHSLAWQGLYGITKAGVIHMTMTLGNELGASNIQVNAIAPGFIKTKMSSVLWQNEGLANKMIAQTPAGRIGDTEDIAGVALFLASSASNYITGQTLVADGGITNVYTS
ncbi:MAG: SDR family oxidoreductase [Chloroflexi bacterium]|uniref:SDR family oxidoreductase n=1 Tax=Candidatus Chlorohelix allophototropha TaxID=3003348 RepID=A0A8T7LZQ5_9CHLR|nr:SDR family oxidoreductase [Chloroflexota bacterium]WJW66374.1 SDR family oxidoreductase [Chloroflexota bacterium L227-S17]